MDGVRICRDYRIRRLSLVVRFNPQVPKTVIQGFQENATLRRKEAVDAAVGLSQPHKPRSDVGSVVLFDRNVRYIPNIIFCDPSQT
jgi:hypothetical protein